MNEQYHITADCLVRNNTVCRNGQEVFVSTEKIVAAFLLSLYETMGIGYPRFYKMDNLCKLGWLAAEVLLKDVLPENKYQPEDMGLVLANANASLDTDIKYQETIAGIPSPSVFVYTLPNIVTGEICIRNNFKGETAFFVSEHFDTSFIHQYVTSLLDEDLIKACICGWIELVGEEYMAVLYLVEKSTGNKSFTKEQMDLVYKRL